jgi:thiol-disulfide isomerase/thioredoxin
MYPMKFIIPFAIACLIIFSSCQKKNSVTISGEILNYNQDPLLLIDYKISSTPDTIVVNDGKFTILVEIDNPSIKFFVFGQNRKDIFLLPSKDLKIAFDAENFENTFSFVGPLASENSLLDSVSKRLSNIDLRFLFSQPVTIASDYLDSVLLSDTQYFSSLIAKQTSLSPKFIETINASIEYNYAAFKIVVGLQNGNSDSSFYSFANNLSLEKDQYLNIPNFRMFLDYYVSAQTNIVINQLDSAAKLMPNTYFNENLKVIEGLKNKNIREYALFNSLKRKLEYEGVKDFDEHFEYFKKNNTNTLYAEHIGLLYEKKQLLAPGMPAPQFTCINPDSNSVSLNDLKGKLVYIDFWATWCGPCRQETPHYLKLQSDYADKDIAFVSISLDDDKDGWMYYIKDHNNKELNLFGGKGWGSKVATDYQINGIPTFVLIDKEGNIIDSQAPRPSSFQIRSKLDELLSK